MPNRPGPEIPQTRHPRRGAGALVAACAIVGALATGLWLASGANRTAHAESRVIKLQSPHVVVLKSKRTLYLMDGDQVARQYPIDLGTSPVGPKRRAADGRTPEGCFTIATRNADSPYHRFLGISYPTEPDVERGLADGLLSSGEAATMLAAIRSGARPDWSTLLGGGIGIHGHRKGRDWTAGCIAVADKHVEELFAVLRIGDSVEILP